MRANLLRVLCVAGVAAAAAALECVAAEPAAAPDPALTAQVSALLRQLDSDDYRRRDAATTALEQLPGEALPLIEDALSAGTLSPEVALRLEAKVSIVRRKAAATAHEAALRRDLAWARDASLAAYDGGGHANPKWDAAVREALVLHVRPDFDPNRSTRDDARIAAAIRRAADLGCDDPFFLYVLANRYRAAPGADPARALEMMDRAATGVLAGNYPPVRKLFAAARRAEARLAAEPAALAVATRRAAARDVDAALALLPAAAKDGAPRPVLLDAAATACRVHARLTGDEDKAFAIVHPALGAATPGTAAAAHFAAETYLARADALRTAPVATRGRPRDEVDADRAKALADLRARARAALAAALAADPQDVAALTGMLRLLSHDDDVPADEFDRWFDRAMAAYPNNLHACELKLAYLERRAGRDQRIAFGRECLAGGNWNSRIPLIAVDAHLGIVRFDRPEEHMGQPDVWADVSTALEGYLKRYPNAVYDRTTYAKVACWAGRWDVAKTQFDRLGDDAVYRVFRGKPTYDYYRRRAERMAKAAPP
jgi:hypothetical protein